MTNQPLLELNQITVERGGRSILSRFSFSLLRGELVALEGANGAGKTTLLRTIAGFIPYSSGKIECEGVALGELSHYCGHQDAVKPLLSVEENLQFWADFYGVSCDLSAVLNRFHLVHLRQLPASYLSMGQKRRLALARLIICPRPLWLLDEPLASLDSASQALFQNELDLYLKGGGSVILATHQTLQLSHRRLILGEKA